MVSIFDNSRLVASFLNAATYLKHKEISGAPMIARCRAQIWSSSVHSLLSTIGSPLPQSWKDRKNL